MTFVLQSPWQQWDAVKVTGLQGTITSEMHLVVNYVFSKNLADSNYSHSEPVPDDVNALE